MLIIGAIGTVIVVSLVLLGIGSARTSLAIEQSHGAMALATACAEEALQRIEESTSYTGNDTLTLGQGVCTYIVTNQGGQNRTITSSGTVSTIIRKAKISIDTVNPAIRIVSWQEVADF